jgi:hypothetical protein
MKSLLPLIAALSAIVATGPSVAKGQAPNSGAVVKMDAALDAIVPADLNLKSSSLGSFGNFTFARP